MKTSSRPEHQERAEDIAIVGMSCLVPGAAGPARFWQNVVGKVDAITDAPPDWQPEWFYDPAGPAVDRSYTRRGGFLGDLCRFHPPKYGVPPTAVEGAEPDHFIALKCAFEAMADAGCPEIPVNRAKTGVILGRGLFVNRGWVAVFQRTVAVDQLVHVLGQLEPDRSPEDLDTIRRELKKRLPPANSDTFPGLVHSALVGRIANRLDLHGPAYTVDAACSSTLLAVEHGIRELQAGTCDAVLVGGSQVSTPAPIHIMFCHLNALSREGKIAPFSPEAEGTVLGQGCGILLLKRKSDAVRDGNRIYALIKGAGTSSDGKGAGLLAPRTEGQQLSIERAYEMAGVSPDTVGLVEAHGTGIPLGDAVEINSLKTCFGPRRGEHPHVAVGSVKSMVGHLVPASGAVSLIKTALALHHRVLPPMLHAETANPALKLDESRFFLCTEPRPWIHGGSEAPRRAGVNAFGFGGINAHVLLEEYQGEATDDADFERVWSHELVVVSADSREALSERVAKLAQWVERSTGITLLDVAASASRWTGKHRLAVVASSLEELTKKLTRVAPLLVDPKREKIQDRGGVYWYDQPLTRDGRVALVFPGEGSQYVNMLGDLCRHFPVVRREFDLTSRAFETKGTSLARVLFPQPATAAAAEVELFEMDTAVASVTAAARGLWRLLGSLGVTADAVVGHSSGEYAALLAAGAYEHDDDRAMQHAIEAGIDSAVELKTSGLLPPSVLVSVGGVPEVTLEAVLAEESAEVTVAIDNCPHQKILVGSESAMSRLLLKLQGKGGLCQRLAWDRPYHTDAFAPACEIVKRYFDSLKLRAPRIELWSCASAAPMPADAEAVRELAVRQWRSEVKFRETILGMHEAGVRVFIECGPRGNLSTFVADSLGDKPHAAVPLDVPNRGGLEQLCRSVGTLVAHGVNVDLAPLFVRRNPLVLDLEGPPHVAPPDEPILRLDLPMLDLEPEVVAKWQENAPRSAVSPAPHENGAHNGHAAEVLPPIQNAPLPANRVGHSAECAISAPTSGNRPALAQPILAPKPPQSIVQAAHAEFQRTMQQFLDLQVTVGSLRGGALSPPPLPVSPPAPQLRSQPEVAPHSNGSPAVMPSRPAAASAPVATLASAPRAATAAPAPVKPSVPATVSPRQYPFVESLLEHTAQRVVFECELTPEKHPFIRHHTFFGSRVSDRHPELTPLPIMPLAMSMELLAEAAALLVPQSSVVAISNIVASRWLPFPGQSRRVRAVARLVNDQTVDARLLEADGDAEHEIVAATIELGELPETLGAPQLARPSAGPPPWKPEAVYKQILYHGPAFRGIEEIESWGASAIAARVQQPKTPLLASGSRGSLVLPVALIDTASQIPGLTNGDLESAGATCIMAFPNTIGRLEFARGVFDGEPLAAVSHFEMVPGKLNSDTEFVDSRGQAVLRYLKRVEETVPFPLPLYRYAMNPHTAFQPRTLNELFADVPGADRFSVCEATAAGERLWIKGIWARMLAHQILSPDERAAFNRLKLPPVALADWLLGRLAAKEAVRVRLQHGGCHADTEIRSDAHGRPEAWIDGQRAADISLSHKTFEAVAVASQPGEFRGLGIDCEPLDSLPVEVLADAFTDAERELLASAGDATAWLRAGWGAKEAAGKALGRGVLGGPRNVVIESVDQKSRSLTLSLRGQMAEVFPDFSEGRAPITAHWRPLRNQIIVLCILPMEKPL